MVAANASQINLFLNMQVTCCDFFFICFIVVFVLYLSQSVYLFTVITPAKVFLQWTCKITVHDLFLCFKDISWNNKNKKVCIFELQNKQHFFLFYVNKLIKFSYLFHIHCKNANKHYIYWYFCINLHYSSYNVCVCVCVWFLRWVFVYI